MEGGAVILWKRRDSVHLGGGKEGQLYREMDKMLRGAKGAVILEITRGNVILGRRRTGNYSYRVGSFHLG